MLKIRFIKELDSWLASTDEGKTWKILQKNSALTSAFFQDFEDDHTQSVVSY